MNNSLEEDIIKDIQYLFISQKNRKSGGKNTNFYGKDYEKITDIKELLLCFGFQKIEMNKTKFGFYLVKKESDKEIVYISQNGFKLYMQKFFNLKTLRIPDEIFIVFEQNKYIFHIIEKKEQRVEGSAETKLWARPSLKQEYYLWLAENLNKSFQINYIFSLSDFFKKKFVSDKKYIYLEKILTTYDIKILYGQDKNYNQILLETIGINS